MNDELFDFLYEFASLLYAKPGWSLIIDVIDAWLEVLVWEVKHVEDKWSLEDLRVYLQEILAKSLNIVGELRIN